MKITFSCNPIIMLNDVILLKNKNKSLGYHDRMNVYLKELIYTNNLKNSGHVKIIGRDFDYKYNINPNSDSILAIDLNSIGDIETISDCILYIRFNIRSLGVLCSVIYDMKFIDIDENLMTAELAKIDKNKIKFKGYDTSCISTMRNPSRYDTYSKHITRPYIYM